MPVGAVEAFDVCVFGSSEPMPNGFLRGRYEMIPEDLDKLGMTEIE